MFEFRLDRSAHFTWCSEGCAARLGVPELAGERLDRFVSLQDGEEILHALLNAFRGVGKQAVHVDMIAHGGATFPALIELEPEYHKDGQVTGVAGTIRNPKRPCAKRR